ncbi:ABC-type antimicrobial peptide transport system permease subunit [Leeuwenhoekiella aestuarii]|uniref:ABC-type antimicrobial peptide transport system permease subunit n=1 Tax=Leeuwenhoekiella aestuarii TaxID=2249426 RepID=A0A4Q0P0F1_9FLAO|nr:ABC transporter permease [Leeuwenhoekiella aestuarii]RXG18355.1 ABC-type antimicrobial peptide transport system permease subunit [Leeuwenhoekiella aestuarii]RXG19660.1 ABC-type antimicrobial peptide transport system permease subunit [Leeuwenhoekiella aestuarii]
MLRNYIKIALRNLWKDKSFTLLNVLGLSIAFTASLLLGMYAFFDLSYDQFHKNKEDLFQVYYAEQKPGGQEVATSMPVPFAPALQQELPNIKHISRYISDHALNLEAGKELDLNLIFVDPDFFQMFSFETVLGTKEVLKDNAQISITEETAQKLFGKTEALGETLDLLINGRREVFTVGSILKDPPVTSGLRFDVAVNFSHSPNYTENLDRWDSRNHSVFIQLNKDATASDITQSAVSFTDLHYKGNIEDLKRDGAQPNANGNYLELHLLPFKDIHFADFKGHSLKVSRAYPYMILGIGLLILCIAGINFVNMSIARSAQRLREIGMRKTLGAAKKQLFFQFWSESVWVFMIALLLGIGISMALESSFRQLFNTPATLSHLSSPVLIGVLVGSFVVITFIAGGYPALVLSKLGTLKALKGKLDLAGKNRVRNTLMVVQFSIAIVLISGTLVLGKQLDFMRNKDLGFNKSQVVAVPLNGKHANRQDVALLRNELAGKPGIHSVTASDNNLGLGKDGSTYFSRMGFDYKGRGVHTNMLVVDYDYPETLGLHLKEGRTFSRSYSGDSLSIVINEAMARELQEKDPVNKQIILDDSIKYTIVGVLKDYNFQSLNKKIEPISLFMKSDWDLYYAFVKVAPQNMAQTFESIEDAWKRIEPNAEFLGSFLDENIDRTFKRERTMTTIITSGSLIAIILSCIGLFAISMLVVTQRTKEIGVRKVVGASVAQITVLLTKDFVKLVGIAFVIAAPVAWWLLSQWLQDYEYRIELQLWIFLAAGLLAVFIALVTISFRTIRAALKNPVESLRTE